MYFFLLLIYICLSLPIKEVWMQKNLEAIHNLTNHHPYIIFPSYMIIKREKVKFLIFSNYHMKLLFDMKKVLFATILIGP